MPEGPEVKASVDFLKNKIVGKQIVSIKSGGRYENVSFSNFPIPSKVINIQSHGKFSYWQFENFYLAVTYGMSGQWFENYSGNHVALEIVLDDGSKFSFVDPRRFGTIKIVDEKFIAKKLKTLGPCILSGSAEPIDYLNLALKKPKRTIAEVLMDQDVFSGVGNYIKSEALFAAKISPNRNLLELSGNEFEHLVKCVVEIAKSSYDAKGASIKTYRTPDGSIGATQFNFKIYNQAHCPEGHEVIRQETQDKRTSWICKICQNLKIFSLKQNSF